jgi:hypothetical protein
VVCEFVVEDGLEGGDDADAAYVEELGWLLACFVCTDLDRRRTRAFGGAMVYSLTSADTKICFNG